MMRSDVLHRLVEQFGSTRRKRQMTAKELAAVNPESIGALHRELFQLRLSNNRNTSKARVDMNSCLAHGCPSRRVWRLGGAINGRHLST